MPTLHAQMNNLQEVPNPSKIVHLMKVHHMRYGKSPAQFGESYKSKSFVAKPTKPETNEVVLCESQQRHDKARQAKIPWTHPRTTSGRPQQYAAETC